MKKIDEFLLWFFSIATLISTAIFGFMCRSEPFVSIMADGYTDHIGAGMLLVLFPAMLFTFYKWVIRLVNYYCKKLRRKSELKYNKE